MTDLLLIAPLLLPMVGAVLALFARHCLPLQQAISVVVTFALVAVAGLLLVQATGEGIQVLPVGSWPAPFGIVLVADLLSTLMLIACNGVAALVTIYGLRQMSADEQSPYYHPLALLLLLGVNGSLLTGDLFNLYVWFEVMLLASFVLLTLGRKRDQLEGAMKYVTLNLVASMIFLTAVGLLYGKMGTLNFADLAMKIAAEPQADVVNAAGILLFVAFGIKAALFPFFFWLPASYHTPPVTISAMFAGLLTKVGMYAIIRVFTLVFEIQDTFLGNLMVWIAGFTMVVGVLGAAAHYEMKRILSFHIVSQIGYILMGLTFLTPLALGGAIFFIIHNMVAKTNLFLVAGMVEQHCGTTELKKTGGLYAREPMLAALFFISAIALAGLPPLSGFWAKFSLVKAGFDVGAYAIVGVSLAVGIMTLFSMTKIWAEAFWKEAPDRDPDVPRVRIARSMTGPVMVFALLALGMGLWSEPFFAVMEQAGTQLLQPQQYMEAVLSNRMIEP